MNYPVEGVESDKDKKKIEKALEDAGFVGCEVDSFSGYLKVPAIYSDEVNDIFSIVATVGEYTVSEI